MNSIRALIITIIFCGIAHFAYTQNDNSIFCRDHNIYASDSNKLYLDIENANLFKNNEYFNNIVEGYTLIGYFINPRLTYYPFSKARIEAGVHFLKYSGLDNYTSATPIFTFQYSIGRGIDILLGTLYGSLNHRLIEPLYRFEGYMEQNIENGLQLLVNKKHFTTDVWLNWEKYIFTGDPFQEEFTLGTSSEVLLTDKSKRIGFSLPLQTLVAHKGGQITSSGNETETLVNTVSGFRLDYRTGLLFPERIGLHGYYVVYKDLSPVKLQRYNDGDALYPNIFIENKNMYLMVGYWYAKEFIAPGGEPIFQSVSQTYTTYREQDKELLTAKLIYRTDLSRDISMGLRFEFYYDIIHNIRDFSYGFHMIFNRRFFLKDIN